MTERATPGSEDPLDRAVRESVAEARDEAAQEAETERHAANLELFVDLAFVFATAQITTLVASSASALGFGRGVLMAWLIWWLWSQFAWMGSAVELGQRSKVQLLVLGTVPLVLLVAVTISGAFGSDALEFAGAYLAVNLWTLLIQGRHAWSTDATRRSFLSYAPLAALGPLVLLAGAFLEPAPRTVVWTLVAVFNVGGALMAGARGTDGTNEWAINPSHFVERHSLFVIIVLGEAVVAAGAAATAAGQLTPEIALGALVAAFGACAYWWAYFTYLPSILERSVGEARGPERGRVARDLLTFFHFPVIFGIVLYAVTVKHAVAHPTDPLEPFDRFALGGSLVFLLVGFALMQLRVARWVSPERLVAIAAGPAWVWLAGPWLPAWATMIGVAAILVGSQAISLRRLTRAGLTAPG